MLNTTSLELLEVAGGSGEHGAGRVLTKTANVASAGNGGAGGDLVSAPRLLGGGGSGVDVTLIAGAGADAGDPEKGNGGAGGAIGSAIAGRGISLRQRGECPDLDGGSGRKRWSTAEVTEEEFVP